MSTSDGKFIQQIQDDRVVREALVQSIRDGASETALKYARESLQLTFTPQELIQAYAKVLKDRGLNEEDINDLTSAGKLPEFVYGLRYAAGSPLAYAQYASYAPGSTSHAGSYAAGSATYAGSYAVGSAPYGGTKLYAAQEKDRESRKE